MAAYEPEVLHIHRKRLTSVLKNKVDNMHLFFTLLAQRLPNGSFNDSFFQTPPLRR